MATPLRIASEPDGTRDDAAPGRPLRPILQPVPLMCFDIEQDTERGPEYDRILLWRNQDAARCQWCPRGDCTFQPGPEGQGNCVIRRQPSLAFFEG